MGGVQERKVSPPDLPPQDMYKPLGQLLQLVQQGHKFHPVTVSDVANARSLQVGCYDVKVLAFVGLLCQSSFLICINSPCR